MKVIPLNTILILLCLTFAHPHVANSLAISDSDSDIEELIERAEQKVDEMDEEKALELFSEALEIDPENYTALWNKSLLTTRKYYRVDDEDVQIKGYREALKIAEKTLELHSDKGHSHYVYAVAVGRYNELEGTRDMIEASHEVGEHVEKAAELIPDYAPVWHLYGVWHSDIANVNRAERAAASLVSEGLPDSAENEKAEEYLQKAIDMMPENILFRLDLAKHYMEIDEAEKAREHLEEIASIEPNMMDDYKLKEEAKELLEQLS